MRTDGVFISIGYEPHNELARKIGLELDAEGYVKTDDRLRTSLPGIYAAGDITGATKQISVAVGQGSIAAITAFEDITQKLVREPLK
jgi:thioredoxin reductase (NADPH)